MAERLNRPGILSETSSSNGTNATEQADLRALFGDPRRRVDVAQEGPITEPVKPSAARRYEIR
jgi:hypothetical protein